MLLSYCRSSLEQAERLAASGCGVDIVLETLRELPLDDFAEFLMLSPQAEFPALASMLPRMASPEAQQQWTGADGYILLRQTLSFIRICSHAYAELRGRTMKGARILDWGCGYGRILRLAYFYSDPTDIFACDPWDKAVDLCRADGLLGSIVQSDYLPTEVPFTGTFDLIYAFSVFTHLSHRATIASLAALSQALSRDGLLVVTVRPLEYWDYDLRPGADQLKLLKQDHMRDGFAYIPHGNVVSDGEAVYGDTSMTLEFLARHAPGLKICRLARSLDDPYQLVVFLQRA